MGPVLNVTSGTIGAGSFTDFNYYGASFSAAQCGTAGSVCPDVALSGSLNTTTGTITGLGADSLVAGAPTSDTFNVYPIDSAHAFAIETDDAQLGLLYLAPYTPTPAGAPNKGASHSADTKTERQKTTSATTRTSTSQTTQ